jgi:hypothetical protein
MKFPAAPKAPHQPAEHIAKQFQQVHPDTTADANLTDMYEVQRHTQTVQKGLALNEWSSYPGGNMNWFTKLFQPEVIVKYRIVELPEIRTHLKGGDKEIREVISTLSSHAGFIYLTDRLNRMNAAIDSKLKSERHADMRAVDFLQAGIYWTQWLQGEVARATQGKQPERSIDPMQEELDAFKEIDAAIERIE